MGRLEGKTGLVTGGRKGIGRGIVELLADSGATVVTCGRGERPDGLREDVLWHRTDVSVAQEVAGLREFVASSLADRLDILVNNAGVQIEKTVVDSTDEDWDAVMGVNAKGVFHVCRAFIPLMGGKGSIINIGSIAGDVSDHGMALYNASKAFVHGLTRSIAVDHPGIRCNAISPGWIMTEMAEAAFGLAKDPKAARRSALTRHPAGRFGTPGDIANTALWLAGDESEFVTGQCFTVDGGLTAGSPIHPNLS